MPKAYNRQYGTNFISVMPTNLYGPNDNFDLQSSRDTRAHRKFVKQNKQTPQQLPCGNRTPRENFSLWMIWRRMYFSDEEFQRQ